MEDHKKNTQTFTAMFEGFARAIERFNLAAKKRDAIQAFVAIFETLNWAVALDERTCKDWHPKGKPLSWAWREEVIGADIMRGVRFARNSVHHQWSDALELDETGLALPTTLPAEFFELRWCPLDKLPARPPARGKNAQLRQAEDEAAYQLQLQGEAARLTVQQLANVFNHLRKLIEPSPRLGLSTAKKLLAVQPNASRALAREPSSGKSRLEAPT